MFDAEFFADPYPVYARLRAEAPVQPVPIGSHGHRVWMITGYAEARAALADPRLSKDTARFFADRPSNRSLASVVSRTMLATDPPDHTRLRRLVTSAFTSRTVQRLRPRIEAIADELLDDMAEHTTVDLVDAYAAPLPITVISELLGVPEPDRGDVRTWSNRLFTSDDHASVDAASHRLADYMTDLVAAKRASPGDDLISRLIAVHDDGDRLSAHELVSLAVLLIIAGHETTTTLIANATLALLTHPEQLASLHAEPSGYPQAVEELLRYDPPSTIATFRHTIEGVHLGDTEIPAGEVVMIALGAANRDPARFPDPDRLNLDRTTTGHLAFGHGPHHCLGALLARLEAEIALRHLIDRFPHLHLATDPTDLTWRPSRLIHGPTALLVNLRQSAEEHSQMTSITDSTYTKKLQSG